GPVGIHQLEEAERNDAVAEAVDLAVDEVVEARIAARRWRRIDRWRDLVLPQVTGRVRHPAAQPVRRIADVERRDVAELEPPDGVLGESVAKLEAVDRRPEVTDADARH